ncbi:MAG TPA: hypothetical protein VE912_03515 [Bacteroidales bacterium]|nr:hypothetical protein [Bacteroidales bacterium]
MRWNSEVKSQLLLLLLFLIAPSACLYSQLSGKAARQDVLITYIKKIYRLDDLIYQGRFYQEEKPRAKGSPYFLEKENINADLYIANRYFPHIPLYFNIVRGELVMQIPHGNYMKVFIALPAHLVDSFKIDHHLFISSHYLPGERNENYFEEIYRGKLLYLMHYEKHFVENYTPVNPNGFYSSASSILYIAEGENWTPCTNRRSFLKYFSTNKSILRRFMRKQHIHFKKASAIQLKALCAFADKRLTE